MALESGYQLQQGRYQIEAVLGQGGMGTVYLAADRNLPGRFVAIKENSDASQPAQEQFQHEAVLLARLTHPNLPRVTDHFIEPSGLQYLVMDYVEGDDLRELLRQQGGPLPEKDVLTWLEQVMSALEHMHNWINPATRRPSPIIHRDIKPGNIKRTPNGRIVLVDFGLAKYEEGGETTIVGARAVTPGYSPVEQYTGGTNICSDIYALGATLYILLTGQKPPDSPALAAGTRLASPRQLNPQLTRNTERVILRAMQVQGVDRYQSIAELRAALANKRAIPIAKAPQPAQQADYTLSPYAEPRQRGPANLFVWLGGLLLLSLLVAGIALSAPNGWTWQNRALPATQPTASTLAVGGATATGTPGEPVTSTSLPTSTPVPMPTLQLAAAISKTVLVTTTVLSTTALSTTAPPAPSATPQPTTTATQTVIASATATASKPSTATSVPSATPTLTPLPTASATATPTMLPTHTTTPPATPTVTPTVAVMDVAPKMGDVRVNPRDQGTYVFVPGGDFLMGSTITQDETPAHTVALADFWIGQTEVTNAQYARCVDAGACTAPRAADWRTPDRAEHPVTHVDWSQARAYALWAGGRLPTEAEWEKAARGTDARIFPWVDVVTDDQRLNFDAQGTVPVGSYPTGASPYGALDMAGNVEEWVADWYAPDYYTQSPSRNPLGPASGLFRVVRGGSFNSSRGDVRTTSRGRALPDTAFENVGFRIVVPDL